jgi:hypothetical protein
MKRTKTPDIVIKTDGGSNVGKSERSGSMLMVIT